MCREIEDTIMEIGRFQTPRPSCDFQSKTLFDPVSIITSLRHREGPPRLHADRRPGQTDGIRFDVFRMLVTYAVDRGVGR